MAQIRPSAQPKARLLTPVTRARAARYGVLATVGIVLYVLLDVIVQLLPPHYSVVHQAESDLAVGPYGFVMTINFLLRGGLSLALLAGLRQTLVPAARSRAGEALLAVWAVGAVLLAIFPTDIGQHHTIHGLLHLIVAFVAFLAGAAGEVLMSLRLGTDPAWRPHRPTLLGISWAALAMLVLVVLVTPSVTAHPASSIFGLVERAFLGFVLLWMLLVALRLVQLGRGPASARERRRPSPCPPYTGTHPQEASGQITPLSGRSIRAPSARPEIHEPASPRFALDSRRLARPESVGRRDRPMLGHDALGRRRPYTRRVASHGHTGWLDLPRGTFPSDRDQPKRTRNTNSCEVVHSCGSPEFGFRADSGHRKLKHLSRRCYSPAAMKNKLHSVQAAGVVGSSETW